MKVVVAFEDLGGRGYETTEQDSGRVVVDAIAEAEWVEVAVVRDGETEGRDDAI